ncbi:MAG: serine/threonine-protein kinase [Pirellulaceae bacterium]|nr:serine/threonine-protein kinase [Pirellulaceae bacterium]
MPDNRDLIREIFLEAIELPSDEQAAFIHRRCAGDKSLLDEVTSLVSYHTKQTLVSSGSRTKATETSLSGAGSADTQFNSTVSRIDPRLTNSITANLTRKLGRDNVLMLAIAIGSLVVFSLLSWYLDRSINRFVRESVEASLNTLIKEERFSVENWLDAEFRIGSMWASNPTVVEEVERIDVAFRAGDAEAQAMKTSSDELRRTLNKLAAGTGELRYAVWNREYRLIADSDDPTPLIGNPSTPFGGSILSRIFQGEQVLWLLTNDGYITSGFKLPEKPTKPSLALVLPIVDPDTMSPMAAILITVSGMQDRFESVFAIGRTGVSGETYAINKDGYLITASRFAKQLAEAGLLRKDIDSPLEAQQIRTANPGGDITAGFLPDTSTRAQWPLTKAAAICISKEDSIDIDGYADYRGVPVVGAWTWLEKYGFGIITEINKHEAYAALTPLRTAFRSLIGLLGLLLVALVAHTGLAVRARKIRAVDDEIGPYKIGRQIGEGGLAKVYLARHSLLNRDCALKILRPDRSNSQNLSRFAREVQLACRLTHPNSISIYDYGTMADGSFYCAMEFIAGYTLQQIVEMDGPQAPTRVAKIVYEICRSLREAHARGMVHRDIKLQNIMLCERGGEFDCVKVLDFGLAKEVTSDQQFATETRVLVGTPMYIAPERIADPRCLDPRSDIFSLGVLAHILITGKDPFVATSSVEAMYNALKQEPILPTTVCDRSIPPELDHLIYECQLRHPDDRPQSVGVIIERLLASGLVQQWTDERAKQWWQRYPKQA